MNIKPHFFYLTLLISLFTWSCDSDEDHSPTYGDGAFVANEGGFGAANGSVTYYDADDDEAVQTIFKTANNDNFPGDVLQSITFDGATAYLVLNGSSKIEVVNSGTFKSQGTITHEDIDKPRYLAMVNGKAYISVWGAYDEFFSLVDSYILVVDPGTMTVEDKIDTDEGVENLLYNGTWLFASNYNFGGSNTLAVIDPADNTLEDQIELAAGPKEMALDANGKLWVICTGTYEGNDGVLFRLDPASLGIEDSFELGMNTDGELGISPDGQTLYYSNGTAVYTMAITDAAAPADAAFEATDVTAPYGLDVDPATGDIYICDALNYATEGKVYIYSGSGTLKTSFSAGISPTGVVFR